MLTSTDASPVLNLSCDFSLWIFFTKDNYIMKASEYEQNLKKITEIKTITNFWEIYQHLQKPSQLPLNCELFFFKSEIKPVWENKHNRGGGKFIVRPKKHVLDKVWEKLLLESLFLENPLFCGIDLNSKRLEISIWTKELELYSQKEKFRNWIFGCLGFLDKQFFLEFKEHPLTEDLAPLDKDWDYLLKNAKESVN